MAELGRYEGVATDDEGNVLASPTIEVRTESVGGLPSLFSDRFGLIGITNPFTGNADGTFAFHVVGGSYKIIATKGAVTRTKRYQPVGTMAEQDMDGTVAPNGIKLTFDSGVTDVDPGTGQFRGNSATFASVTKLWIDNTDTLGTSITAWINALDDYGTATARGRLRAELRSDPTSQWAEFEVTGSVVDKTGYREVVVTPIAASNWPFTDAASVMFSFTHSGQQGIAGISAPAIGFTFSTTTTDSDPGNGTLRFNSATPGSVTFLYIDNVESGGSSVTGWLDSLGFVDNPTVRGYLYLNKTSDPTKFFVFRVTGAIVDGTGYRKVPVTYLSGPTLFANGDSIQVMFAPAADAISAGVRWNYESSTTMAAPASGGIRFDNVTMASVTNIAVNALSAESSNPSVRAFVNSWDDSGTTAYRGNLIVKKAGHTEVFAEFKLTGSVTDNTTWQQLAVTYIGGAGSFSAGDRLDVVFVPTGAQGSDMVLLTSGTIANSASSLDIVLTAYTAYRKIIIDLSSLIPATDGVQLLCRFSTDGGSTYDSAAASYQWEAHGADSNASGFTQSSNNSDTSISLTGSVSPFLVGNGSSEGIDCRVTLYDQTNTAKQSRIRAEGVVSSAQATPALGVFQSGGQRKTAQDTDAIRFLWSSGNFAAASPGKYAVYGMN